jgi:ribonuclease HI
VTRRVKIFFDGGCRPNPGRMVAAIVAGGEIRILDDLGQGTSEAAEWLALIHALRIAREMTAALPAAADFVLLGDAAGVIRQANGLARPRGAAVTHLAAFRALAAGAAPRIRHVGRSQNLAGIALARRHPR